MAWILALVGLQTMWAGSYIAFKVIVAELPIPLALVLRYGLAALVLVLISLWRPWRLGWRDAGILVAVGVLDFCLAGYLMFAVARLTYAGDMAILIAFEPLITTLLAVLLLRERLTRGTMMVLAVAMVGVLLMSELRWEDGQIVWSTRLLGNALFLIALLCESGYSVCSRAVSQRVDPLQAATLMFVAGALGNLLWHYDTVLRSSWPTLSPVAWAALLFLGLGCSALGYTYWTYLLRRTPVQVAALSLFLQPVIGSVLAYAFLNERPSRRTVAGALIVCSSLFLWVYTRKGTKRTPGSDPRVHVRNLSVSSGSDIARAAWSSDNCNPKSS